MHFIAAFPKHRVALSRWKWHTVLRGVAVGTERRDYIPLVAARLGNVHLCGPRVHSSFEQRLSEYIALKQAIARRIADHGGAQRQC